jgi:hypothetical protein
VTPILVRPVREQLEHDRVIRLLQQKWRRKYVVGINQGSETTAFVGQPGSPIYPDVVLAPPGRPAKPVIIVEVETAESVNNLEAMAEWVRMGRLKAAFHLYVPTGSIDSARRLCADHNIPVAEICAYHLVGDQMRFTQVYKAPAPSRSARQATSTAASAAKVSRPAAKARPKAGKSPTSKSGGGKPSAPRPTAKRAPTGKARPRKASKPGKKAATKGATKARTAARKRR